MPFISNFIYSKKSLTGWALGLAVSASLVSGLNATQAIAAPTPAATPAPATSTASANFQRSFIGERNSIRVEQLAYKSGKLNVRGRLYLPPASAPLPLVIFNHDGIDGITTSHHKSCLRIAQQGYAVIAPSFRGEDGSQGSVEIAKGEVDDVLNLWSYWDKMPEIDHKRTVLMGASHGALISLLASSRQPQNLRGLIFAYGVAEINSWWQYLKRTNQLGNDVHTKNAYGDGPQARPQSFAIRNGLNAVPKLQVPTLILQGKLDDIVPYEQAQILHRTLQNQGKSSKLCLYPNALHGFLVYAPYLKHDVTAAEKREAEEAWQEVFNFLQDVMK